MSHGPKLHWLSDGRGFKGGIGRCRRNHGREGWVGDIYGRNEGRRNIRGREGWVEERGDWREDKYKGKGLVGGEEI